MNAVIKTGGKQYKIKENDIISVEKLEKKEGDEIVFNDVLLVFDDKKVDLGEPTVKGAKVIAKVLEQGRAKKVLVVKYKRKTRYKIKKGHRQPFSKIQIIKIETA